MNNDAIDNSPDAQAVLNKIVLQYMRDQKRQRRWRWFTRALIVLVMMFIAYQLLSIRSDDVSQRGLPHVGIIDLKGEIFDSSPANSDNFVKGLDKAYSNKSMQALIIRIDSPGGSPVQADYMYNALIRYKKANPGVKVYAVCVDACASAAYYVASAADNIYANPSSIVGSIGVLYNGFGFVDAMQKLGITRRLETAGRNKGFMDPFSAVNPAQEKLLQSMLDLIHQEFISKVKQGRGTRLKIDEETFSGLFWTGIQAKERGLIDGFASSGQLAHDIIKIDALVDYTYKESVFERVAKNIGTAMANQLPEALGMRSGIRS